MGHCRLPWALAFVPAVLLCPAAGDEYPKALRTVKVSTVEGLEEALEGARPGDHIVVADGVYETTGELELRTRGTKKKPIVVRAANRGKATITGEGGFEVVGADYTVIDGFAFRGAIGTAVKLYECSHARFTRNHIRLTEDVNGPKMDWVVSKYDGEANRIDHNLMEDKRAHGRFVYVYHQRRNDLVDYNHFRNNSPEGDNGRESIVVRGYFTTVEGNLFENCSGEGEIISVKSIHPEPASADEWVPVNTFRGNTFLDCVGTLCLRQANRCLVERNYFIGSGGPGYTGGVKVYGDDHVIRNNYFEGLTGSEHFAPFVLMHGDADIDYEIAPERYLEGMPSEITMFPRPNRVEVSHNTWVNCSAVELGWEEDEDRPLPSRDCSFTNNLIVSDTGQLVKVLPGQLDLRLRGNMVHATGEAESGVAGYPFAEFRHMDPKLVRVMGLWIPSEDSPARDGSMGVGSAVWQDVGAHDWQSVMFLRGIALTLPRWGGLPALDAITGITPNGGTFTEPVTVTLPLIKWTRTRYTLDDTRPTGSSPRYRGPLTLTKSATVRVLLGSSASFEEKATFTIMEPLAADEAGDVVNGLEYEYYEDKEEEWWSLPDFDALEPVRRGTAEDINLEPSQKAEYAAIRFRGFIEVPRDGVYTFSKRSNGGCQLHIGAMLVLDNDGLYPHSDGWGPSGSVALKAGRHAMTLLCFERDFPRRLELHYSGPGIEKQRVPASALYRKAGQA